MPPQSPVEQLVADVWEDVLGRPGVGRNDNFFQVGGNSLSLMRVATALHVRSGVDLPLSRLYESPDLLSMAAALGSCLDPAHPGDGTLAGAGAGPSPATFAQAGIWLALESGVAPEAFHIPIFLQIHGRLNVESLATSFRLLVRRHGTLRASFEMSPDGLVQRVTDPPASLLAVEEGDVSWDTSRASAWARERVNRPFDLSGEPGVRASLLSCGATRHYLLIVVHHLVADGWSIGVIIKELLQGYGAPCREYGPSHRPSRDVGAAYACWQKQCFEDRGWDREIAWWRERLAGARVDLVPTDRPRHDTRSRRGERLPIPFSPDLSLRLRELATCEEVTTFTVLLTGFALLLRYVSGSTDLVVGTDFAGRDLPGMDDAVGCFVNQLPLRLTVAGNPTFRTTLRDVVVQFRDALEHRHVPGELIASPGAGKTPGAGVALFQVKLVLQPVSQGPVTVGDCTFTPLPLETGMTKWDLLIDAWDEPGGIAGALTYDVALFERSTACDLLDMLLRLLAGGADHADLPVEALFADLDQVRAERRRGALTRVEETSRRLLRRSLTPPHPGEDRS